MRKRIVYFSLLLLTAGLFLFTRLYKLASIPYELHIDEASMAYSSWCLAHYGVDRYTNSWPIYIQNFYGGQSALYPYLLALLLKFFNCTVEIIRTPAVIFSILTFVFGMLICQKIYPTQKYPLILCGLLITICPYFILASRFGLDCNLMLGASTIFLYYFAQAIRTEKNIYYCISGILAGLVLYTYALSYLIMPLFLLVSLLYLVRIHKFKFRSWVIMAIPLALLAFPLLLEQYVNILDKPEMQLGIFTITKLDTNRATEIGTFTFEKLLLALKSTFLHDSYIYNSTPVFYNLYKITVIFFILGAHSYIHKFLDSLKGKHFDFYSIPLLWFLAVLFAESHVLSNVNKINSIFFVTILISVEGIVSLCNSFKKRGSYITLGVIATIYISQFLLFGNYYYNGSYIADNYPLTLFYTPPTEAIAFIEEHPACQYKTTYMAEDKVYYALASLDSPYQLNFSADNFEVKEGFYCASLPEIDPGCNYIVRNIYTDYANNLRVLGFTEIEYENYSLFYTE